MCMDNCCGQRGRDGGDNGGMEGNENGTLIVKKEGAYEVD